jgi:hypothetical protein
MSGTAMGMQNRVNAPIRFPFDGFTGGGGTGPQKLSGDNFDVLSLPAGSGGGSGMAFGSSVPSAGDGGGGSRANSIGQCSAGIGGGGGGGITTPTSYAGSQGGDGLIIVEW